MASSKSPGGRFGMIFGIKRRPSTNFQQSKESPPASQQTYDLDFSSESDPFKANVPSLLSPRATPGAVMDYHTPDFEMTPGTSPGASSDPWLTATEEQIVMRPAKYDQRRAPNTAALLTQAANALSSPKSVSSSSYNANIRDLRVTTAATDGPNHLTIRHDSSVTSAESLALAAAIAHANGLILQPSPSVSRASLSGSGAPLPTDEYPSPPPSRRDSSQHGDTYDPFLLEEEEIRRRGRAPALSIDVLTVATTGTSSLPTTPNLIDSFPATPHTNMPPRSSTSPAPSPSTSPREGLAIRGGRQRAGSAADAWIAPMVSSTRIYRPDIDEEWAVAEKDEGRYNYYPLPPNPGPPPSAPLPPEPLSPRLHSSALHKHMQQLELEFGSLTQKLSPISPLSAVSSTLSTASSPTDVVKMLKKYPSRSKLHRESSSGISGSSGASPNRILPSSVSTSTVALPLSDSSPISTDIYSNSFSSRQNLSNQHLPVDVSSSKTKEKDKKLTKERDGTKGKDDKDKDKDSFPRRRFFAKYASIGSVDKEAAKVIADVEDSSSMRSMQSGTTGFMDEELGTNLSLAISSSQRTQESCLALLSVSPPNQRSPGDDKSSLRSMPQTPTRSAASQHILPPAELLRLERVGFNAQDHLGRRGRDPSLSTSSTSPLSTSPLSRSEWSRRSTSTSRVDVAPLSSSPRTRPHRSGSLATLPSSSSAMGTLHNYSPMRENPLASRSFAALPRSSETLSQRSSNASSLTPPARRPISSRSVTTPSSPLSGHSALSPPPRPCLRSLKTGSDLKQNIDELEPESADHYFTALSPPPRSSRRPSTAGSSTSSTQRQSILRKPSFLDIEDDDGRPSLEEASASSAPGLGNSDHYSPSPSPLSPSPSIRPRQIFGGSRSPSSLSISTITTTRQAPSNTVEDSFLDMGKASLETIRSESNESDGLHALDSSRLQQPTAHLESISRRSPLGPHYQRGNIMGSRF